MPEPSQITLVIQETGAAAQQAFGYHVTVDGELVASPAALTPQQSREARELAHGFSMLFERRSAPTLAVEQQRTIGTALFERWLANLWPQITAKRRPGPAMLVVASASSAILNLPWELMRLPNGTLAGCDLSLAVRRLPLRQQRLAALAPANTQLPPRPLRVLFLACAPHDQDPLDYEREEALLLSAVSASASVDSGDMGTFEELRDRINSFQPHVVHLTGHGIVTKRCPDCQRIAGEPGDEQCRHCQTDMRQVPQEGFFAFEDERGETDLRSARAIAQELFAGSAVQAAFISGCQSGKAPPVAAVGGICAGLVGSGLPLAIGWAASVEDTLASVFAETFYSALAKNQTVDRAAIQARQALRERCDERGDPSWALPLVYAASDQAFVYDTSPRRPAEPAPRTFDAQSPLPGIDEGYTSHFVGRRRETQRRLPDLRDGRLHTLLITGMGGAGKSTLATRLARKLEADGWMPIAVPSRADEPLNAALLLERCGDAFRTAASALEWSEPELASFLRGTAQAIADPQRPPDQRLRDVVGALNRARFVLVLDNFETTLEPSSRAIVDQTIAGFYRHLLQNLTGASRAIITSRYLPADMPRLPRTAHEEPLSDFPFGAFLKLLLRDEGVERRYRAGELPRELLRDLHRALGGAPRFLEQLRALLQTAGADELAKAIGTLAAPASAEPNTLRDEIDRYCETLIVPRLFDALAPEQQQALCRAAVYGIAVSVEGLAAAADAPPEAVRPMLPAWQQRAFAYPDAEHGDTLWALYGVLRPWLLGRLPAEARQATHKRAGEYLRMLIDRKRSNELGLSWIDCIIEARSQFVRAGDIKAAKLLSEQLNKVFAQRLVDYISKGEYNSAIKELREEIFIRQQVGENTVSLSNIYSRTISATSYGHYSIVHEELASIIDIIRNTNSRG